MTADRFLPLIEQMYAREWLLERALTAYREYVQVLEGEPEPATAERIETTAHQLNEALDALEKGPVRV